MNLVGIATAGCRATGTSKSGIASDILVVDGLDLMDSDLYIFLYIFSLFIHICCGAEYAYTIEVDAGKHNCFFQTVNNTHHKFMEIDYQASKQRRKIVQINSSQSNKVVDGGDLNINFMMLFGTKILLQEMMKVEGSHKFSMEESGDYQLCFDNSFSYQTRKVLFFELFLLDENGSFDETNTVEEFGPVRHEYSGLGFEMQKFQVFFITFCMDAYKLLSFIFAMRAACYHFILCTVYMIRSLFEDNSKLGQTLSGTDNKKRRLTQEGWTVAIYVTAAVQRICCVHKVLGIVLVSQRIGKCLKNLYIHSHKIQRILIDELGV
uniref:GOLD domain-containing protein n=1 Tax=Wuchereria bancrofti TaxID=6293 RepID=A0A1I8EHT8_WUCBA